MICVMRAGGGRVGVLDDLSWYGQGTKPWSQSTCQIKAHDTVAVAAAMPAVVKLHKTQIKAHHAAQHTCQVQST